MGLECEKLDYCQLSMQELIDRLYKLESKKMYDLSTDELEALADGDCIDVDALMGELAEHIYVLTDMKAVYEEIMLRVPYEEELDC